MHFKDQNQLSFGNLFAPWSTFCAYFSDTNLILDLVKADNEAAPIHIFISELYESKWKVCHPTLQLLCFTERHDVYQLIVLIHSHCSRSAVSRWIMQLRWTDTVPHTSCSAGLAAKEPDISKRLQNKWQFWSLPAGCIRRQLFANMLAITNTGPIDTVTR